MKNLILYYKHQSYSFDTARISNAINRAILYGNFDGPRSIVHRRTSEAHQRTSVHRWTSEVYQWTVVHRWTRRSTNGPWSINGTSAPSMDRGPLTNLRGPLVGLGPSMDLGVHRWAEVHRWTSELHRWAEAHRWTSAPLMDRGPSMGTQLHQWASAHQHSRGPLMGDPPLVELWPIDGPDAKS